MISWKSRPEIPPDDLKQNPRSQELSGISISSRGVMTDTTPGEEQMK